MEKLNNVCPNYCTLGKSGPIHAFNCNKFKTKIKMYMIEI